MPQQHRGITRASQPHKASATVIHRLSSRGQTADVTVTHPDVSKLGSTTLKMPNRGMSAQLHSRTLQERIRLRSLALADRFRVIRTIDVAVACFAERPFKAALTAAQRATRGMVKDELLKRYRTDRFQTVYALTQRGVDWLAARNVGAAASVRRVSDMSNPEHRLWAQFLTLCAEARGLRAYTEQEVLRVLVEEAGEGQPLPQGLLSVGVHTGRGAKRVELRPDALALEEDGMTWFEVDRSARGVDRAASLKALVLAMGRRTRLSVPLRRVVLFTRSPRIQNRVLATLNALAKDSVSFALTEGRRVVMPRSPCTFDVVCTDEMRLLDGRTQLVDSLAGIVIVQALPTWLPRYRVDGRDGYGCEGWFDESYLPYERMPNMTPWLRPTSPLSGLSGV